LQNIGRHKEIVRLLFVIVGLDGYERFCATVTLPICVRDSGLPSWNPGRVSNYPAGGGFSCLSSVSPDECSNSRFK